MSCPYTSQQNGKVERMIRTVNNVTRTLLFQASMPRSYWADALATATYLINRLPTKTLNMSTPFSALHGTLPSYSPIMIFVLSGAHASPTFLPPALTNLPPAPPSVHSLVTHQITRAIGVSTSTPTVSSFSATLSSTKQRFLSPSTGQPLLYRTLIF